ncbi:ABC transporter ATP-binding protein [Streptomyces sp. GD-15H]|uniref:ABC transporter ATP-binding protein n=1 Tax=Streptomyces sp. GD-15H TaxID=3129112 RepID=UPI003255E2E3
MTSTVLTVDDLSIIHPARRGRQANTAVDRVTVTADAGEIVGIVGESGSGKTSLAMAVAGLGRVTDGVIGVGRVRPGPRMSREDRAAVQMVFQDPHASLDPRQSIGRGLRELRKLHPRRTDWIDDVGLLARVGLPPEVLDRLPHQISGGQAQRVSIARALLLRPTLLLADEPTSALDVSVQAQILKLLKELRDTDGLTILFISHDLAVVRTLCDRVYVMRNGVVVESGRTAEVLEKPRHEYTRTLLDAVPGGTARTGAEAEPSRSRGTAPVLTEAPVRGAS